MSGNLVIDKHARWNNVKLKNESLNLLFDPNDDNYISRFLIRMEIRTIKGTNINNRVLRGKGS